ncbi:hypothetical protein [Streptomyces sp. NPDC057302]|uniref:hypothetical protein n=1 Tax=Streptomyces sp. NPDC057302 TaxID=3346094 RepID=UPI0036412A50
MKQQIFRHGAVAAALATCLIGAATPSQAQASKPSKNADTITTKDYADRYNRIKHVKSAGTKCGKKPLAMASGKGKMILRIDETRTRSTTKSKSIQATYKAISVAVGWDVTKSRTITVSGSKEVPRGKYGTLKAYTKYAGKKFDVYTPSWNNGNPTLVRLQKGKKAWKPVGACFKYKQRNS